VASINGNYYSTARDYVDKIQYLLQTTDNLNKGENDGEDLSDFKDSTIETKLKNKIYDSSITIVLISKNMWDHSIAEDNQWIPWEVAYSLRDKTRDGRTSRSNGMLAVILPDENGQYNYFLTEHFCQYCDTINYNTNILFKILRDNMFNEKNPTIERCTLGNHGPVYKGEFSYIKTVKWSSFIQNMNTYFDNVTILRENIDKYNISINVY